jgi:hypothetical protein
VFGFPTQRCGQKGQTVVKVTNQLYVTNRKEWRTWLEENYSTENEVWLVYYKKRTRISTTLRLPTESSMSSGSQARKEMQRARKESAKPSDFRH